MAVILRRMGGAGSGIALTHRSSPPMLAENGARCAWADGVAEGEMGGDAVFTNRFLDESIPLTGVWATDHQLPVGLREQAEIQSS